jgi:hypothetical protein
VDFGCPHAGRQTKSPPFHPQKVGTPKGHQRDTKRAAIFTRVAGGQDVHLHGKRCRLCTFYRWVLMSAVAPKFRPAANARLARAALPGLAWGNTTCRAASPTTVEVPAPARAPSIVVHYDSGSANGVPDGPFLALGCARLTGSNIGRGGRRRRNVGPVWWGRGGFRALPALPETPLRGPTVAPGFEN